MTSGYDLTSADNPRVKAVARLRESRQRRKTGLFVAEGVREISRARACGLVMREAYWCPDLFQPAPDIRTNIGMDQPDGPRWFRVTSSLMKKMSYIENPEGVLAIFEQPAMTWETIEARLAERSGEPPLFLVAVGTTKPGNLGAMLRTAEAAGATAVLVSDAVVDLYNPNAIRASTGAIFTLPVIADSAEAIITFLRRHKVRIYAADPAGNASYDKVDLRGPIAIVIGAEDTGLDDIWRREADELVRIDTCSTVVDSLNAATSAAILLFESLRQRREEK